MPNGLAAEGMARMTSLRTDYQARRLPSCAASVVLTGLFLQEHESQRQDAGLLSFVPDGTEPTTPLPPEPCRAKPPLGEGRYATGRVGPVGPVETRREAQKR